MHRQNLNALTRSSRPIDCPDCGKICPIKKLRDHRLGTHLVTKRGYCEWCLKLLENDKPKDFVHRIACLKQRLDDCSAKIKIATEQYNHLKKECDDPTTSNVFTDSPDLHRQYNVCNSISNEIVCNWCSVYTWIGTFVDSCHQNECLRKLLGKTLVVKEEQEDIFLQLQQKETLIVQLNQQVEQYSVLVEHLKQQLEQQNATISNLNVQFHQQGNSIRYLQHQLNQQSSHMQQDWTNNGNDVTIVSAACN